MIVLIADQYHLHEHIEQQDHADPGEPGSEISPGDGPGCSCARGGSSRNMAVMYEGYQES